MKIHTKADEITVRKAAELARVTFDRFEINGSRTSDHGYDVTLFGASERRSNSGGSGAGDEHAATWDQWGVFLAAVFDADPDARMTYYKDAGDFHYQTSHRFRDGWPEDAHGDHSWDFAAPGAQTCRECSAVRRLS